MVNVSPMFLFVLLPGLAAAAQVDPNYPRVTDLAAVPNSTPAESVTLSWKTPPFWGDDTTKGDPDHPVEYDLRYSTQGTITTLEQFNDPLYSIEVDPDPTAGPPGEDAEFTVVGLTGGTRCNFCMQTRYERLGWTGLSNSVVAVIPADATAPDAVDDLSADPGSSRIILRWIAAGDNGASGTADHFILRRSIIGPIESDEQFDGVYSEDVTGLIPDPVEGGQFQRAEADADAGVRYWFAVKTVDEADNESPLSTFSPEAMLVLELDGGSDGGGGICPPWSATTASMRCLSLLLLAALVRSLRS